MSEGGAGAGGGGGDPVVDAAGGRGGGAGAGGGGGGGDPVIDAALAELGVRRMLLAIHDASFPCDPDEDLGRGAPSSRATERLLPFLRGLGFTGLQLGPQGQTSRDNPSPYDGTLFSRHAGSIGVRAFRRGGPYEGLVGDAALDALLLAPAGGRAQHARAHDATERLLDAAAAALAAGARPDLAPELSRFVAEHRPAWLAADARYAAHARRFGGVASRDWPAPLGDAAAALAAPADPALAAAERRHELAQWLAHDEHARFRAAVHRAGLVLYGDLQVGLADADLWAHRPAFLVDYLMGAPPSRTNPEGQPWGYAVLDPAQLAAGGPALALFLARIEKAFSEYDGLRIDHPHGLVCPWVYRADAADGADPAQAVRDGARLHESPDLPDHPGLARFAIARADQLDRARPRYHDAWVRELEEAQVARYALLFDAIAGVAARRGRSMAELSCEVLSTMPLPLGRVLARHGLGRWRVTQKANLTDPADVYRAENAAPADWVMLGNHDTRPIFELDRALSDAERARWIAHLGRRLALADPAALAAPGRLPTAMLAELLLCPAENVSIFFADLFGYEERYNVPGLVSTANWSVRLPADAPALYADRLARGAALDVRAALALALDARGSTSGLAARLRA